MSDANNAHDAGGPPPFTPHLWSRDGFNGDICVTGRPYPIVEYTAVTGPHAPHRIDLTAVAAADAADPAAEPTVVGRSTSGAELAVSRLAAPMPHLRRNAEQDEMHFVQEGEYDYVTDFGTLRAGPGDFVALPRAVTHRVVPVGDGGLRIVVSTAGQLLLKPPAPFGMINLARDVARPDGDRQSDLDGPVSLVVKAFDGLTRFTLPRDPMRFMMVLGGQPPVWKVNLAAIQPLTYEPHGGPPDSFAETGDRDLLFYTLSSRTGARPPMHYNADFDELIFYFRGPGAYGEFDTPGQLAWVPKSIGHWGPEEDVPDGYLAWLLESVGTFRLTEAGAAAANLMETGEFGISAATEGER
ncbi:hypothetical protein [Gordonia shandongensis]|uniref:hypothetical protein n=1 Tax=Gordonia shandongensis TaxID=376351 RepID=UPI00040D760C|nr:hypothetical protein [Gordonia shandongensis]